MSELWSDEARAAACMEGGYHAQKLLKKPIICRIELSLAENLFIQSYIPLLGGELKSPASLHHETRSSTYGVCPIPKDLHVEL